jgi:hypothetical protein
VLRRLKRAGLDVEDLELDRTQGSQVKTHLLRQRHEVQSPCANRLVRGSDNPHHENKEALAFFLMGRHWQLVWASRNAILRAERPDQWL